jgi:hypothetical protein
MLQPECRGQSDFPSFQNSTEKKVCVPHYDLQKTVKKKLGRKSTQTQDLLKANIPN